VGGGPPRFRSGSSRSSSSRNSSSAGARRRNGEAGELEGRERRSESGSPDPHLLRELDPRRRRERAVRRWGLRQLACASHNTAAALRADARAPDPSTRSTSRRSTTAGAGIGSPRLCSRARTIANRPRRARHFARKKTVRSRATPRRLVLLRRGRAPLFHHSASLGGSSSSFITTGRLERSARVGPRSLAGGVRVAHPPAVHSWSANLMLLAAFRPHVHSVYFMKRRFRRPREITWFSCLALIGLGMVFGFSGYPSCRGDSCLPAAGAKIALKSIAGTRVRRPPLPSSRRRALDETAPAGLRRHDAAKHTQRFFALLSRDAHGSYMALPRPALWIVQKHGNAIPPVGGRAGRDEDNGPCLSDFLYKISSFGSSA